MLNLRTLFTLAPSSKMYKMTILSIFLGKHQDSNLSHLFENGKAFWDEATFTRLRNTDHGFKCFGHFSALRLHAKIKKCQNIFLLAWCNFLTSFFEKFKNQLNSSRFFFKNFNCKIGGIQFEFISRWLHLKFLTFSQFSTPFAGFGLDLLDAI